MKAIIFAVLIAALAITIHFDIQLTQNHFYNNGHHLNCGGAWTHCIRDNTSTWFYCDYCGITCQFK